MSRMAANSTTSGDILPRANLRGRASPPGCWRGFGIGPLGRASSSNCYPVPDSPAPTRRSRPFSTGRGEDRVLRSVTRYQFQRYDRLLGTTALGGDAGPPARPIEASWAVPVRTYVNSDLS